MRDFRGSVAGSLPRKQSNVFCFQYVTPWQWQDVAGLCHARKVLKTKRKSRVVADAWQGSTNVHSAALLPQRAGVSARLPATQKSQGQKTQRPRSASGGGVSRSTEAFGAVKLCPHHMDRRKVA